MTPTPLSRPGAVAPPPAAPAPKRAVAARALGPLQPPPQAPYSAHTGILTQVAALVEADASVARYETAAGRAAMLATLGALALESSGVARVAPAAAVAAPTAAVALTALLVAASAAVVGVSRSGARPSDLVESVIASLTAAARSAGALTAPRANADARALDACVDAVVSRVFDDAFLQFVLRSPVEEEE